MARWLLVRTRSGALEGHSSTRRPSVQRGDRAVCYLAGRKVVFAVVEVVSDPENDPSRTRWQWRFGIRPLVAIDPLEAPPVEAAGVLPRSLGRHSYVRLTADQFESAAAAIADAAGQAGDELSGAGGVGGFPSSTNGQAGPESQGQGLRRHAN